MYTRLLRLSDSKTFFLWGQRQAGKSTLLKDQFKTNCYFINLLDSNLFLEYTQRPMLLKERCDLLAEGTIVLIDEVQKVPLLLDVIHLLIEEKKIIFGLCGSSARKLKRGHGNLLGGRARRYELYGLSAFELGQDFNLQKILTRGYIPNHYNDDEYIFSLKSYVSDYLKEEILSEGLTRNLPIFSKFLETAAFSDCEIINFTNISREIGVTAKTVINYFDILVDTLTGSFLSSYTHRPKRRTRHNPKFYFADVGIVNILIGRLNLNPKTSEFGKAFENWIFHELNCFRSYLNPLLELSYWSLTTGVEVDFILGKMEIAIEAKSSSLINNNHLKNLRELKKDFPNIQKRIIVCLENEKRITEDQILILPYQEFIKMLFLGKIYPTYQTMTQQ